MGALRWIVRNGQIRALSRLTRGYAASATTGPAAVRIVEVGPRDGLQNEPPPGIPVATKVELIRRLVDAGLTTIEAGSFVSPKWTPQMAGTAEVVKQIPRPSNVIYQVLVPNTRGLSDYLAVRSSSDLSPDEIAIFTAATDSFSRANTNVSRAESLLRLGEVAQRALDEGLRVRGYVSVTDTCPYEGPVDPGNVREMAKALKDMGCYEVSLGDTTGTGTPARTIAMIEEVVKDVPLSMLAGHFHDTFGTSVSNIFAALALGMRTFDAAVGGLGGCPYSPGATGNVATEDILYALEGSSYKVEGVDFQKVVETGWWITAHLGREAPASRVGKALWTRRKREEGKDRAKL